MRKVRLSGALMLALLAGTALPLAAQTPTQGKFQFITGRPYVPQPTITVPGEGTFYTSIYQGQFLSGGPTTGYVDIYCVDFFHEVHINQQWDAWFTPLSSNDFSHTYGVAVRGWETTIAQQRYNAAAWLASQFGAPTDANKALWPAYQAAIWSLMGRTSTDGSNTLTAFDLSMFTGSTELDAFQTTAAGFLSAGLAGASTVNGNDWTIISQQGASPNASGLTQEFLVQVPTNVVPEPATVVLLVTGLLAIGGVAYFRGFSA